MTDLEFLDRLPDKLTSRASPIRAALLAHPGQWIEYWGANPRSVHAIAKGWSTNGDMFQAATRSGKGYLRAVPR